MESEAELNDFSVNLPKSGIKKIETSFEPNDDRLEISIMLFWRQTPLDFEDVETLSPDGTQYSCLQRDLLLTHLQHIEMQ